MRQTEAHMNTIEIAPSLRTLLLELVEGAPATGAYMLNRRDPGLLRSLETLDASAASRVTGEGSSIAAHVDHLRYGLSLLNRWAGGENPWADADWTVSWRKTSVSETEWKQLRADFRDEAHRWLKAIESPRQVDDLELNGIIGSIAHVAYHMGAIRQIDRAARGPSAESERAAKELD
jgi:hypothetical protein